MSVTLTQMQDVVVRMLGGIHDKCLGCGAPLQVIDMVVTEHLQKAYGFACTARCCAVLVVKATIAEAMAADNPLAFAQLVSNKYDVASKDAHGVSTMLRRREEAEW